jgi:nucleoside-diphosphate-sugar epimerase
MREAAVFALDSATSAVASLANRRVCVTGGRGAIGTRLTRALLERGVAGVTTVGRHAPRVDSEEQIGPVVRHFIGSVLDPTTLDIAFTGCSVVFHLAGLSPAQCASDQLTHAYEINTRGAVQVIDACYRAGVSRLVHVSTAQVYGVPRALPVGEDHPAVPLSVYAASKLAAEVALQGVSRRGGVVCDVARLSNVYGGLSDPGTVIGRALSQAALGQAITLDDLAPVRDFLHEDDAVAALIALACCDADGVDYRVMNVSSGHGVSIGEMAQTLARVAAERGLGPIPVHGSHLDRASEVPSLVLDNARLCRLTGWYPKVALDEGLRRSLAERVSASGAYSRP